MGIGNAIRRTRKAGRLAATGVLVALAAGCASPPEPFPELPRLGVATQLTSRNLCGLGVSPAISINKVPPATARYRLRLTNTDVLIQTPWQTTADATPGGFAEGALADYQAPCVGDLTVNNYYPYFRHRLEVLALDAQGRPLAYGSTTFLVQSVSATVDRARNAATQPALTPMPPPPPILGPAVDPRSVETIGNFVSPALTPQLQGPVYQP
jgi:hypothetical protein